MSRTPFNVSADVDSLMRAADKDAMQSALLDLATGFVANGDAGNPGQSITSYEEVSLGSADGSTFINTFPETAAIIVQMSVNLGNLASRVIAMNAALKSNKITDN